MMIGSDGVTDKCLLVLPVRSFAVESEVIDASAIRSSPVQSIRSMETERGGCERIGSGNNINDIY
jgi:hypothetical protein